MLLLAGLSPFLLKWIAADLAIALILVLCGGLPRQIGKGMLIAWVALPITILVVAAGIALAPR